MRLKYSRVFKNVIKVSLFASIFVIIFISLSYLFRPTSVDRQNISGYYAEKSNTLDMVYIGGSVCFVSWSPLLAFNEEGFTSYDFASNTIQADTLIYSVKEVLKSQSPELLVIDARPFQYRDKDQPPSEVAIRNLSDGMMYSMNRANMLANIVPSVLYDNVLNYLFDIAKYHDLWKSISKANFLYNSNAVENRRKGFWFISKKAPVARLEDYSRIAEPTPPQADTVDILEELLEYCKGINQKILFVVAPYRETKDEKKILDYVGEMIKKNGFDYIDFNDFIDKMGIDFNEDFYNKDHLSIYGARKYTKFLALYISENYNLPDRRNDFLYNNWNDQYTDWESEYKTVSYSIEHDIITKSAPTIYNYLAYINDKRFSTFIVTMDEASNNYNAHIYSLMKNIGFNIDLTNRFRSSYLGVVDQGNVMIEEAADMQLSRSGFLADGTSYSVLSAGHDNGNTCSIIINNIDYAKKSRGLNIVVYDNKISQVIDSVCFDTYADKMLPTR